MLKYLANLMGGEFQKFPSSHLHLHIQLHPLIFRPFIEQEKSYFKLKSSWIVNLSRYSVFILFCRLSLEQHYNNVDVEGLRSFLVWIIISFVSQLSFVFSAIVPILHWDGMKCSILLELQEIWLNNRLSRREKGFTTIEISLRFKSVFSMVHSSNLILLV